MRKTLCPKCGVELPRRGRFCLDCGLDLYAEGLRRAPVPWLQILVVLIVVGVVAFVLIAPPWQSNVPFEIEEAGRATRDLLALLAKEEYNTIVARYYRPNTERFGQIEQKLWKIMRGDGARGRKIFESHEFPDFETARAYVRKNETANVDYVAKLLHDMATRPQPWMDPQRAEVFLAWYLKQAFGGPDAAPEEIGVGNPEWKEGFLTVKLTFPEPLEPLAGVDDPSLIRWRLIGSWGGCRRGRCVLTYGQSDHLNEVLDLLKRLPAE